MVRRPAHLFRDDGRRSLCSRDGAKLRRAAAVVPRSPDGDGPGAGARIYLVRHSHGLDHLRRCDHQRIHLPGAARFRIFVPCPWGRSPSRCLRASRRRSLRGIQRAALECQRARVRLRLSRWQAALADCTRGGFVFSRECGRDRAWAGSGGLVPHQHGLPADTTAVLRLPVTTGAVMRSVSRDGDFFAHPVIDGGYVILTLGPAFHRVVVSAMNSK
jgi:hypothetical protein